MDVLLTPWLAPESGWNLMMGGELLCDRLVLDGHEVPLDNCKWRNGVTTEDSYYKGEAFYHVEYYLKEGVNFIPEKAFYAARFKSISIPEGIVSLRGRCFASCKFECDITLPDSLERICKEAFDKVTVDGKFIFGKGIKHIRSLPESESKKDEIIIPEGVVSFCPDKIATRHLHIPSTLKVCEARFQADYDHINSITISPENRYFIVIGDTLVNLKDVKKK